MSHSQQILTPAEHCAHCGRNNAKRATKCTHCKAALHQHVDDIALPLANGAVGQQHIMRFLPLARCYRPIDELGHDYFKLQSYFLTHFLCVARCVTLRRLHSLSPVA